MKRRTLDIIFSIGGATLAVLVLVLGLVLRSNAVFAQNYVHDQLVTAADHVHPGGRSLPRGAAVGRTRQVRRPATHHGCTGPGVRERLHRRSPCRGERRQDLRTRPAVTLGPPGPRRPTRRPRVRRTQPSSTRPQRCSRARSQTLFRGETLRGLLLTSYGFSIFGDKAMLASWVCLIAGFVLLLASAAGFVHAFRTSKNEAFAPVETSVSQPVPAAI